MLTLATTDTISGVATSASKVTYTIFGDAATGSDSFQVLAQGQLAASAGTLYTVPGSTSALIASMTFVNNDTGNQTITLYRNGTDAAHAICTFQIPAGGTALFNGERLEVHDSSGATLSTISLAQVDPSNITDNTASVTSGVGRGAPIDHIHYHGALGGGGLHSNVIAGTATTNAGFMSGSDKSKLDGIGAGLTNPINDAMHGNLGGGSDHAEVTESADGFMSATDKIKINNMTGSHMTATQTVSGTQATGTALTNTAIVLDNPGQAFMIDAEVDVSISATSSTAVGVGLNIPTGATLAASIVGATNATAIRNTYFTAGASCQQSFATTTGTLPIRIQGVVVLGTATSHTGTLQVIANSTGTATIVAGSIEVTPIS